GEAVGERHSRRRGDRRVFPLDTLPLPGRGREEGRAGPGEGRARRAGRGRSRALGRNHDPRVHPQRLAPRVVLVATTPRAHRQVFLKVGTAGLVGLNLADVLRAEARAADGRRAKATGVILVWLGGGPATIDMWDLKLDAPEEIRGEFKPIDTKASGVRI